MAMAFHKPKDLEDERAALLDRMGTLPDSAVAMERGLKMIEDLNRIDQRRAEAENRVD